MQFKRVKDMYCRWCQKSNPFSFFAPRPDDLKNGANISCVCIDCADRMGWLYKSGPKKGELRPDINLA